MFAHPRTIGQGGPPKWTAPESPQGVVGDHDVVMNGGRGRLGRLHLALGRGSSILTTEQALIVRTVEPGSEPRVIRRRGRSRLWVFHQGDRSMHPDFELTQDSKWPRRLTVVSYIVLAVAVTLSVIHGLPW
jgi:hypothetical protein